MKGWRQARTAAQQYPRQETCVPVRISTVDAESDPDTGIPFFRSTEATTANLSRGGVFVHSWEPLAAGRRVIVALDLPAGGELQLVGRVVWTRRQLSARAGASVESPGYGIQFDGPSRAEQAALQQILDAASNGAPGLPATAVPASNGPDPASTAPAAGAAPAAPRPAGRYRHAP